MERKDMPEEGASPRLFPIVGIGASAGGLESLQRFLSALPKEYFFALVFIQHLSSKHKSLLQELLSARLPSLVIQEIFDGLKAQPGRLYLSPPGREVRLRNGLFQTTVHAEGLIHLPIDEFFSSLAEDAGERSIAVIFSGAGTDGARGCQAVRFAGGSVFVQDPETAEFNSMPLAAIATGQADAVLPPENIAAELMNLQGIGAAVTSREYPITPEEYGDFFRILQEKTGSRFNHYKKSVVSRRIKRRVYLYGLASVKDYLGFISTNDSEAALLASDLMIGVTSFFRDRVAWKALNLEAVRKITSENTDLPVRVWTPASATGEEAYSIAMMLLRELALTGKKRDVQVFATDVNDRALERAREGRYPAGIAADVPQEYIQKYFTSADDGKFLVINKDIRESVVFARQDLLTDPPFSKLDLIICRNFMIYLEPEAQEKCIRLFHYALNNGGYLFLGNAETVGRNSRLFQSIGRKQCRVYRKLESKPASRLPISVPYAAERQAPPAKQVHMMEQGRSIMEVIQEKLLEQYGPASVAIDQNYEIIYHNGPTNRYLRQPRGVPTQNLLELLPESLRSRIRGALYRSGREEGPVAVRTSVAGDDNRTRLVSLRITKAAENIYIVVFQEKGVTSKKEAAEVVDASVIEETAIHQLETELSATRAHLQSYIEQLKSLNEELQSSNEELQAANEELETSREELQSLNEELITVNSQLQGKIEEQDETNNDLNNFLASTNIPTIFLDTQLRVKRFTPAMLRLIKLIPSDVGRPIVDMSKENLGLDLTDDVLAVLEQLLPLRREFEISGAWYVRTALPYRTADNRIEGVVITYNDVTELKRAEYRTRHLASFPQLNPNPVIEVDAAGRVIFANPGAERMLESLGLDRGEDRVFLPKDLDTILIDLDKNSESSVSREVAVKDRVFNETIQLIPQFKVARIYAYDITERKRAEEALRESEERVSRKLDSILSPEGDIGDLDLSDIIDAGAIQSLIDDFYQLARMPMSIIDLKGRMLVGAGWQKICTEFHRAHPETCRNCVESDLQLSAGVPEGEFKLYKCKNNMWDVATPIMVGGKHVGNLFMGQFFFDKEPLDYESFRAQAREYGFDEKEYIAALEAVPRLSRESLNTSMAFFLKLADILSKASYGNLKLARSLAQRDDLTDSLRQSEERLKRAQEISHLGSWELDLIKNKLFWSDEAYRIFGLKPQEFGATYEAFLEAVHPDDRATVDAAYSGSLREGRDIYEVEHRVVRRSTGEVRIVHEKCEHFRDETGRIIRSIGMVQDITERKRAEEALMASEAKYRSLFENMIDGLAYHRIITDENGNPVDYIFLEANEAFERLTGLKRADIIGKSVREALPGIENDPAYWIGTYGKVALSGQEVRFQHYAAQLGKWYSVSAYSPMKGYFVAIFEDVTESKKAEAALRRNEEQFRSMFERHQAVMLLIEPESGAIVDANAAASRFYGYSREQLREMRIQDINQLKPEDVAAERRAAAEEKRNYFIFPHRLADDRVRGVEVYSTPFEAQGRPLLFSVIHDITERKRAEEALKNSLRRFELSALTANELLQSTEPQKVVTSICLKVMEYLDCHVFFNFLVDDKEGRLRLNACAGIPEEEARRLEWLDFGIGVCGCAARDGERIVAEHISNTPDERTELIKSYGIHAFCCHPLLGPGGKVIGSLSFGTRGRETFSPEDLSLMKAVADQVAVAMMRMRGEQDILKLSEDMAARNMELETVNKELESFVYSVSHDLRAPLRAVSGFAKILVEDYVDKLDAQASDYLARIYSGSEKMSQRIEALLHLSRISRQDLNRSDVALSRVASAIVLDLRQANPGRNVEVVISEGLFASADLNLVKVALSNLFENAWKFTSKTENARIEFGAFECGPPLTPPSPLRGKDKGEGNHVAEFGIKTQERCEPGKTVYFVRDNGAGFDPTYADRMFWPFHRLHTDQEFEGTGIGLAIVERAIRKHGGKVWAEGEVGKGATIYFTLH